MWHFLVILTCFFIGQLPACSIFHYILVLFFFIYLILLFFLSNLYYFQITFETHLTLSPSYTVTIQAPIHHDSSRFETNGKIGLHRDASGWKKRNSSINTMSHDAPMVSSRFIYGPTTTHDGSATIHHGGATNAHDASTIRYGASTI